ncbi:hypothetical protein NDU88_001619 [Pleurodeles waltl]|uniref:Uncharacterized protein n=1 Tax=Pleurodeles waltl TaxID=8319 RepID=A0AAV7TIB9_PLEWA|nr:hypothetical protein NDU88_001619 [Pleurodeles waltl]
MLLLLTRILCSCPRHLPLASIGVEHSGFSFPSRRDSSAALSGEGLMPFPTLVLAVVFTKNSPVIPNREFQAWPRLLTSLGLRASASVALCCSGFCLSLHFLLSAASLLLVRILRSCPCNFPLAEVGGWSTSLPFSPQRDSGAALSGKELRVGALYRLTSAGRLSDAAAILDHGGHGEHSLFSPRLSGWCC